MSEFVQFSSRIVRLETGMKKLEQDQTMHEQLIDILGSEFQKIHDRFEALENRIGKLENRMETFEAKVEKQFNQIESKLDLILNALAIKA